jgi:hypothetical protein
MILALSPFQQIATRRAAIVPVAILQRAPFLTLTVLSADFLAAMSPQMSPSNRQ